MRGACRIKGHERPDVPSSTDSQKAVAGDRLQGAAGRLEADGQIVKPRPVLKTHSPACNLEVEADRELVVGDADGLDVQGRHFDLKLHARAFKLVNWNC